jgi:hypothetical protein
MRTLCRTLPTGRVFITHFISATLLACAAIASQAQANGQVEGWVDGVFGPPGAQFIQGWACEPNNPNPLTVHLYTGGPAGTGQLYSGYTANAPNEAAVASACGTTTGHRFFINVTGDLFLRAGQQIFMYGIAQSGGPNNKLNGSGSSIVPGATTQGFVDSVSASGFASGWAVDNVSPSDSIQVAIYADGNSLQGAESGTLVWQGLANQPRPDVNAALNISGNHGFRVQLPAGVTSGVHNLSVYAVNIDNNLSGPLNGSPMVPGGTRLTSQFSFSTSQGGFPSQWFGYSLPNSVNLVGLSGTVSMNNTANIFSEMLFVVGFLPAGTCPTSGTQVQPQGQGPAIWSDIIKGPTAGTFTAPVNFTLPVGVPIQNCLIVQINGGTVAANHDVIGTVNLVATYVQGAASTSQVLGMDNEACFGVNSGCQLATINDTQSFAAATQITKRSALNAIWGNISDSTFDGSPSFGPPPTGPWTALNDVYIYRGVDCNQFPFDGGRAFIGPGNFSNQIPADATHLLSAPLVGGGGVAPGFTINYLLPGVMNGTAVYQTFTNTTLNAGDCLVALYGMSGTAAAFDNEDQLHAVVTPF